VIDLSTESPLSLAAAAAQIPPARNGKRCHLSTVLRWVLRGARSPDGHFVKLEALRLGGRWITTRQALQRFALALTPRLGGDDHTAPRSPARRRRASERAAAELDKAGL
jgi:hypothetical protein